MQLFIYIFTNSKKHFISTNQQHTRKATFDSVTLLMIPHQEWEKLQKNVTGNKKFVNDFKHVSRY